ncbi:MAG: hypothetical protein IT564_02575 [Rhodospirillales bacterium]|nr:hypothetical protein [Rhodospirillales bacterium]
MDERDRRARENGWGRRAALLALAAAALALAGCGRRSTPKAPEGSTYNVEYPTRKSMGLPPEEFPRAPPGDDGEDEAPSAPGRPAVPSLRY